MTRYTPTRELLTMADVAVILGVGRSTMYALIHDEGGPPALRLNGSGAIRVRRSDLDAWIASRPRVNGTFSGSGFQKETSAPLRPSVTDSQRTSTMSTDDD